MGVLIFRSVCPSFINIYKRIKWFTWFQIISIRYPLLIICYWVHLLFIVSRPVPPEIQYSPEEITRDLPKFPSSSSHSNVNEKETLHISLCLPLPLTLALSSLLHLVFLTTLTILFLHMSNLWLKPPSYFEVTS